MKFNIKQQEAIEFGSGPLLIIAGAGTGKTTVITERIKYLVLKKNLLPSQILALTFTDKAAREMEERVDVALPYGYTQMWISTFHSFGDRVLRNEAVHIGLDSRYKLMTEAEAIRFIREHVFEFDLHYFRPLGNPMKFLPGLFQHFSRLKDEDIAPDEYLRWARHYKQKTEGSLEAKKWLELANTYKKYEKLKIQEGMMDFADLISNTLKLFRQRPNILQQYREQFQYILIDEFQDTNIAQYELIKLLAQPTAKPNLTVVGDDSQSIYKFRGAAISNILHFMEDYRGTKIVVLTQNYRSTQQILDCSYRLIKHNEPDTLEFKLGLSKNLKSIRNPSNGPEIEFIHADRVENEAEMVAKKILYLIKQENRKFSDFAILVRANNHADPFVRALSRAGIPYQFLGPSRLFRQPEVKDLIAYLKILYNFEDSVAFYRILSMEHFDIAPRDLAAIVNYSRKYHLTLFEAAERIDDISVSKKTKRTIDALVKMIHKHLGLVPRETAGQIAYDFLEESGLLRKMVDSKTVQDERKAQNISRFFDKLKTYEVEHEDASIFAIVDWIDLATELGESPLAADFDWAKENAVNILTCHSAKGLEFPVCFVVNLVSQRFPTIERREQIPIPEVLIKEILPEGDYHLQEERRLFYVAMTRAMDRLYLTAADYYGEGKRVKKLSPFIAEAIGEDEAKKPRDQNSEQLSVLDFISASKSKPVIASYSPPNISYLSYSQIDTFRFCPMHYKLKYISKIPTPPSAAQSFGTTLHQVLKDFNHALQRNEVPRSKMLAERFILELYEKNWIREGYKGKSHEQKTKLRGRDYLVAYLRSDLYKPDDPPIALEQEFKFPLTDELKMGGRIDRIDRRGKGIEIIDYKTTDLLGKDLPSKRDLARDLQLSIYALAINKIKHPLFSRRPEEITLSIYFFDKGVKVSTQRTKRDLEDAVQEIISWKKKIENSDFSCSGNFWCKDCEYKLFCEYTPY